MYKSNRARTRDLLLEYDREIMPPNADILELNIIYPWHTLKLETLKEELYSFASNSGYSGTYEQFKNLFGSYLFQKNEMIVFDYFENFPEIGEIDRLYFDLTDKILYHWIEDRYEPVNAMLIMNTILDGGEA